MFKCCEYFLKVVRVDIKFVNFPFSFLSMTLIYGKFFAILAKENKTRQWAYVWCISVSCNCFLA